MDNLQFLRLCLEKTGCRPKGVVHLGAYQLEELDIYEQVGADWVLWAEPNPLRAAQCRAVIEARNRNATLRATHHLVECATTDKDHDKTSLRIFNADEASSIYDPGDDLSLWYPEHKCLDMVEVQTRTVDSLMRQLLLPPSDCQWFSLDIQGAEILAMEGAKLLLASPSLRYVFVEVAWANLYAKGSALKADVDGFLANFGFEPTYINRHAPTSRAVAWKIDSGYLGEVPQADILYQRNS